MKKTLFSLCFFAIIALSFASCTKEELNYPDHLVGTWTYANGSTGYTGTLTIEDLDGGQKAVLLVENPVKEKVVDISGSFTYDAATGAGRISSNLVGGGNANIQAAKDKGETLDVEVSQVVSGGSNTIFSGKFNRK